MGLPRRTFLQLAAGAAVLPVITRIARAQAYPTRPVRIVVGFAVGGGADIAARLMGQWLSERLGKPFVVENRGGAGSNIAAELVVNATPDGHTLLLATNGNAVNATLKLYFNFVRDIMPVAGISREPNVMVVNPSVPAKTVPEFIAYAKASPEHGQHGVWRHRRPVPSHMAGELFKMMAGVNLVHVPHRGVAPALADLLDSRVHVVFASMPSSIGYIKASKLRPLAVTTVTRSEALPDIPAMADFVPGYEMSTWYGIGTPKNTLAEVIDKLDIEINAGLADPKTKARLAAFIVPMPMTSSSSTAFDYEVPPARAMSSFSQQPPRTSGRWQS